MPTSCPRPAPGALTTRLRRLTAVVVVAAALLAALAVLYAATAERLLPVHPVPPELVREQLSGFAAAAGRLAGFH